MFNLEKKLVNCKAFYFLIYNMTDFLAFVLFIFIYISFAGRCVFFGGGGREGKGCYKNASEEENKTIFF